MIQNDKQLSITKGKISELEDELTKATARVKAGNGRSEMYVASIENMLAEMNQEVSEYLKKNAPTEDEGEE